MPKGGESPLSIITPSCATDCTSKSIERIFETDISLSSKENRMFFAEKIDSDSTLWESNQSCDFNEFKFSAPKKAVIVNSIKVAA